MEVFDMIMSAILIRDCERESLFVILKEYVELWKYTLALLRVLANESFLMDIRVLVLCSRQQKLLRTTNSLL